MTAVYVPEGNPDAGAVWHYGDPLGEQRAALTHAVLIDRSTRAVLALSGPERLSWLHTVSSQHVADLRHGQTRENLSLDGQGRVEDHWVQTDLDGITYLDTESWRGQPLKDFLTKMVFWSKVEVAVADLKVFTLLGPDTAGLAEKLGIAALPELDNAVALPDGGLIRRVPWPLTEATYDLLVPSGKGLAERLGVRPAGLWAFEALRVAATRTRSDGSPSVTIHGPYIWPRAAIAGRRRWPECTTWASHRVRWCCYIWTVPPIGRHRATKWPRPAAR